MCAVAPITLVPPNPPPSPPTPRRMLNEKIFAMLERYLPNDSAQVLVLHPPVDDDETKLGTAPLIHTMEMRVSSTSMPRVSAGPMPTALLAPKTTAPPAIPSVPSVPSVPVVPEVPAVQQETKAEVPEPTPAPPPRVPVASEAPLPPNWESVPANDGTGDSYFWNAVTNETSWDRPQ